MPRVQRKTVLLQQRMLFFLVSHVDTTSLGSQDGVALICCQRCFKKSKIFERGGEKTLECEPKALIIVCLPFPSASLPTAALLASSPSSCACLQHTEIQAVSPGLGCHQSPAPGGQAAWAVTWGEGLAVLCSGSPGFSSTSPWRREST